MTNQLIFGVVIIPAIIGLVQVFKQAGVPSSLAPLFAVILGVVAGLAQLYAVNIPWIPAIVIGISLGLSAVGLYSATTTTIIPALSNRNTPTTPTPVGVTPKGSPIDPLPTPITTTKT